MIFQKVLGQAMSLAIGLLAMISVVKADSCPYLQRDRTLQAASMALTNSNWPPACSAADLAFQQRRRANSVQRLENARAASGNSNCTGTETIIQTATANIAAIDEGLAACGRPIAGKEAPSSSCSPRGRVVQGSDRFSSFSELRVDNDCLYTVRVQYRISYPGTALPSKTTFSKCIPAQRQNADAGIRTSSNEDVLEVTGITAKCR